MKKKSRWALGFGQKTILWIAALLCLWELLQKQTITDAIFNFFCAGVVPGTNIILSPDAVLRGVIGVVAFGVLLLMLRPVFRRRKRHELSHVVAGGLLAMAVTERAPVDVQPPALEPVAGVEATPAAPLTSTMVSVPRRRNGAPRKLRAPQLRLPRLPALPFAVIRNANLPLERWQHAAARMAAIAAAAAQATLRAARKSLRWFMANATAAAADISIVVQVTAERLGKYIVTQSVAFWRWLEPHLRRFDAWLEARVHATQAKVAKRARTHEDAMFVLGIIRESKRMLRRSPIAGFLRNRGQQDDQTPDDQT